MSTEISVRKRLASPRQRVYYVTFHFRARCQHVVDTEAVEKGIQGQVTTRETCSRCNTNGLASWPRWKHHCTSSATHPICATSVRNVRTRNRLEVSQATMRPMIQLVEINLETAETDWLYLG